MAEIYPPFCSETKPNLTQDRSNSASNLKLRLKGRHILDMEKYSGGWSHVEIGMLSNKFYMQYEPREVLSVNRSCNFWGCSVTGVNYSTYGFVYFTTDKDGYITDYTEDGDAIRSVKHKFKDLLVLEN